mgnify:FL=1
MEVYFFKITIQMIGTELKCRQQFIANFKSLFPGIEFLLNHLIIQFLLLNPKESPKELLYMGQIKKKYMVLVKGG